MGKQIHYFLMLRMKVTYRLIIATTVLLVAGSQALNAQVAGDSLLHSSRPMPVRRIIVPKPKATSKEFSGGLRLANDGWGVFMDYGRVQTESPKEADMFYDVKLFQLDFSEHSSPKEVRTSVDGNDPAAKPYAFGKINTFYSLKLGYGKRKLLAGKPEPGSVSIHLVYAGGLSLGVLKPYYLTTFTQEKITYKDDPETFLNPQLIEGGAGFSYGLGKIKYVPGIHAKAAVHFDFAPSKNNIMAIEAGVNAELYAQKIAIMATEDAKPYLVNLYASFQFGRRW